MIWTLLACGTAEAPKPPELAEPTITKPTVNAAGKIGGMPILSKPLVIGGIEESAVRTGLAAAPLADCTKKMGKLLVRFTIQADGSVDRARIRSTTMRDPKVESCVIEAVSKAKFPALTTGDKAIITWPLVFPVKP